MRFLTSIGWSITNFTFRELLHMGSTHSTKKGKKSCKCGGEILRQRAGLLGEVGSQQSPYFTFLRSWSPLLPILLTYTLSISSSCHITIQFANHLNMHLVNSAMQPHHRIAGWLCPWSWVLNASLPFLFNATSHYGCHFRGCLVTGTYWCRDLNKSL